MYSFMDDQSGMTRRRHTGEMQEHKVYLTTGPRETELPYIMRGSHGGRIKRDDSTQQGGSPE